MRKVLTLLGFVALVSSCGSGRPEPSESASSTGEEVVYYEATGTIVEILEDHVRIDHDVIPGFMDAMTMSFEVKDPLLFQELEPGVDVRFRVAVVDREVYIDQIERGARAAK